VKKRAKIDQHLGALNELRDSIVMVINGKVIMPRMGREMPEKMITHSQENYEKGFKLLDKTLEGKTYLLDDELTLLDFWLVEMMINCVMIELDFE
jgi:glutathione S-transferase